jgi:DNA helicase-2/ATP-dependent DNA helicase PcrA
MHQPLPPHHPLKAVLDDELALLAKVRLHLATLDLPDAGAADYDEELLALRDQVGEARMEDLPALVDQMLQAQALRARRGLSRTLPVDPQNPYFGHLRLREKGRVRDVLVGKRSYFDGPRTVVIVDWRHAPVSRIYYRYEEGDTYEEELGDRVVEGTVLARRTVSVVNGRLTRVRTPDGTLLCDAQGTWHVASGSEAPELKGGRGTAVRPPRQDHGGPGYAARQRGTLGLGGEAVLREDKRLPEIAALIDREQFDLITRPTSGVVVVQGGAGSGKTTVALHRVAFLHFSDPQRFRARQMRVVVSQPALVSYISRVLPSLDISGVPVVTMGDFCRKLRQQLCPALKRRVVPAEDVPVEVSRLKKHPAMLKVLEGRVAALVEERRGELARLAGKLRGGDQALARFDQGGPHLRARLLAVQRWLAQGAPAHVQDAVGPWLKRALKDLSAPLYDVQEALSDVPLLRRALDTHAPGEVSDDAIAKLARWVDLQATEPEDLSHVDPEARRPVDGMEDDASDPTGRLDPHDDALVIRYLQLTHGGLVPPQGNAVTFDHVAVDEAQDLCAVEIQVLADATRHHSLTLAGDTAQKLVFDNHIDTWSGLLTHLDLPSVEVATLKVAYRSTREVVAFSREVLGPLADPEPPQAPRTGAPVEGFRFAELGEEVAFLADALRGLMARERNANLALLARYPAQADLYHDALSRAEVPHLRRVSRQDFTFTPGVDVTDVSQVKGLEYDYVILVAVDPASYNVSVESRHLLHIGATRAAHQLWLTTCGPPSPLVPAQLFTTA